MPDARAGKVAAAGEYFVSAGPENEPTDYEDERIELQAVQRVTSAEATRTSSRYRISDSVDDPSYELTNGAILDCDKKPVLIKDVKFGKCTTTGATMNYITAAIGVGIFLLPTVFADVGIIAGTALLIAAFFCSMIMCKLVGSEMDFARKFRIRDAVLNHVDTMDGVAGCALHGFPHKGYFVWFCILVDNADLLMTCVLFLCASYPMLQKLLYQCQFGIMQGAYMLMLRSMKDSAQGINFSNESDPEILRHGTNDPSNMSFCTDVLFKKTEVSGLKNELTSCYLTKQTDTATGAFKKYVVNLEWNDPLLPPGQQAIPTGVSQRLGWDLETEFETVMRCQWIALGIVILLLISTAFFKDMTALSKLSVVGVVGSAAAAFFVVLASCVEIAYNGGQLGPNIYYGYPETSKLEQIATGFSTIWFSFAVPVITPTVKSDMTKQYRFARAAEYSHYLIFVIYLIVAFFGYLAFGNTKLGEGLHHVLVPASLRSDRTFPGSNWCLQTKAISQVIVEIGILANVVVTYPLFLNPVAITIEHGIAKLVHKCKSNRNTSSPATQPQPTSNAVQPEFIAEGENKDEQVRLLAPTTTSPDKDDINGDPIEHEASYELTGCAELSVRIFIRSLLIGVTVILGVAFELSTFMGLIGAVTAMYTCVYLPFIIHCIFYARWWTRYPQKVKGFLQQAERIEELSSSLMEQKSKNSSRNKANVVDGEKRIASTAIIHLPGEKGQEDVEILGETGMLEELPAGVDERDELDEEEAFKLEMKRILIKNQYTWWRWGIYGFTVLMAVMCSVLTLYAETQ
ncbi:unnamed protein product [Amoebophrya sp. A120]|nr:unnamed protein product [Amoebophrya sp. A120]|eukprot:GSA120T00012129001.1